MVIADIRAEVRKYVDTFGIAVDWRSIDVVLSVINDMQKHAPKNIDKAKSCETCCHDDANLYCKPVDAGKSCKNGEQWEPKVKKETDIAPLQKELPKIRQVKSCETCLFRKKQ